MTGKLLKYLEENWETRQMLMVRKRLLNENKLDRAAKLDNYEKCKVDGSKEEIIQSHYTYIIQRLRHNLPESSIIHKLRDWLVAEGYKSGELKSFVHEDVPKMVERWRMEMMIKLYAMASGDPSGQKLFLQSTRYGDLTKHFNNYLMVKENRRRDPDQFSILAGLLRDDPKNLLFLTSDLNEAKSAHQNRMKCVIVARTGTEFPQDGSMAHFPVVSSLEHINFVETGSAPECC
ncbi:enolase-phosphatase E1-like isoform X2 [Brevipalpus obovatus]